MTARIGRKDHAQTALPHSPWRTYVGHLAKWLLIYIAVLLAAAVVMGVLYA